MKIKVYRFSIGREHIIRFRPDLSNLDHSNATNIFVFTSYMNISLSYNNSNGSMSVRNYNKTINSNTPSVSFTNGEVVISGSSTDWSSYGFYFII
mgnify:CR=1 FL=1